MSATERTPTACFAALSSHVNRLVHATLSRQHQLKALRQSGAPTRATAFFRQEQETVGAPIRTEYGRLYLFVFYVVEAVPEDDRYRLAAREYGYHLQTTPKRSMRSLMRWEYATRDAHAAPSHHVQMASVLRADGIEMHLDRLHIPTGWVELEEVIRFLVSDLGVEPLCGRPQLWSVLEDSLRHSPLRG